MCVCVGLCWRDSRPPTIDEVWGFELFSDVRGHMLLRLVRLVEVEPPGKTLTALGHLDWVNLQRLRKFMQTCICSKYKGMCVCVWYDISTCICIHIFTEIWNSHNIHRCIYIFYRHICIACRCWISNKGQYFPRFYRGSRPIWSKPCKRLGGYFDHTGKKIHCGKLT